MSRPLAAEHRSLRAALADLEAAVGVAHPADGELARAVRRARVVLAKITPIGRQGRPPMDEEARA